MIRLGCGDSLTRNTKTTSSAKDGNFPQKLYKMLESASKESFEDVISWEPNGRSFVVRDTDKFAKEVLPR